MKVTSPPAAITTVRGCILRARKGETVGRYVLGERLGRGGMSVVYRASDPGLQRDVALKFLPPLLSSDEASRDRFLVEAQVAAGLEHPNICTIHEIGEAEDGRLFLAMPLYEGDTLRERIESGPLAEEEALRLALQAAGGLARAHERGVVHRDIKPANLMITRDGTLKILDFGIARLTGAPESGVRTAGTAYYMSPEQVAGREVDARTDLWSLGVVLYEMLTGQRPFEAGTRVAVRHAILENDTAPPSQVRPAVSPGADALVRALLEKDPARRPATAAEMAEEIRKLLRGSVTAAAAGGRKRPGKRLAFAAGGASALAIAGWIVASAVGPDAPEMRRLAVLPLTNLTGEPEQEYFVSGLHDALITELSRLDALMVTSRQSVLRYRGSDRPVSEIAGELGVGALVEGSVLREGDSVRTTVQLVRAEPEETVWTGTYIGAIGEALALQGEVAGAIARTVHARVTPDERARLTSAHAVEPEAQEAYLRGLYHVERHALGTARSEPRDKTIRTGIAYLEDAVALEPEWAAAHAKLALAYHWLASTFPDDAATEFYPKSKAAALRALELDETEAQAHASLGFVLHRHERNWAGAERAIRRALELESNDWNHWIYALYLRAVGRYDEAITHYRRAEERNPLSVLLKAQSGVPYFCARRYDETIDLMEHTLQLWPDSGDVADRRLLLGHAYSAKSSHLEAIAEFEKAIALSDSAPPAVAGLAYAHARAGRQDEARALLPWLEERPGWYAPHLYVALDEIETALAMVDSAFGEHSRQSNQERAFASAVPRCLPEWEVLGAEPRVREILRRVGLPE